MDGGAVGTRFFPSPWIREPIFAGITRSKTMASLRGSDEEIGMMADYAAKFNLAYFSGTYRKEDPSWTEDPAYALWKNQQDSPFWKYMELVMNEAGGDHLHLQCGP